MVLHGLRLDPKKKKNHFWLQIIKFQGRCLQIILWYSILILILGIIACISLKTSEISHLPLLFFSFSIYPLYVLPIFQNIPIVYQPLSQFRLKMS